MKEGSRWGTEGRLEGSGDGNVLCCLHRCQYTGVVLVSYRMASRGKWVKGTQDYSVPFLTSTREATLISKFKV